MMKRKIAAVCAIAALLLAGAPAAASAAMSNDGDNSQLSESEISLLGSDTPIRVTVDEDSGAPLSVEELPAEELVELERAETAARTAYPGVCGGSRGCWYGVGLPSGPPSQSIGFSVGVTNGTWNNRGNFWVPANRKAKVCWGGGSCTDRYYGPSVLIEFGGNVVGTKVDLVATV